MNRTQVKAVALWALLAFPTMSFAFIISEQSGDAVLTNSLQSLVDALSTVTTGFTFDTYHVEFKELADRPLTKSEATQLYDHLDLHVEASAIKEVAMNVLYDKLVELIHLAEIRPQRTLGHLHTLVTLFLKNKGCPTNWQVFEVIFYTEDSAFFEYIALHRPTGTMYAIELGV